MTKVSDKWKQTRKWTMKTEWAGASVIERADGKFAYTYECYPHITRAGVCDTAEKALIKAQQYMGE